MAKDPAVSSHHSMHRDKNQNRYGMDKSYTDQLIYLFIYGCVDGHVHRKFMAVCQCAYVCVMRQILVGDDVVVVTH